MKPAAVRLLVIGLLALAPRAGESQQAGSYRAADPYAPAAAAQIGQSAAARDTGRYPLPPPPGYQAPSIPAAQSPVQPAPQARVQTVGRASLAAPSNESPAAQIATQSLREPVVRTNLFQPGMTVARVGDACIFYGDIAPLVSMELDGPMSKAKSEAERAELEGYREPLTRRALQRAVQEKMLFKEFERTVIKKGAGGDPKKLAEGRAKMDKNIRTVFDRVMNDHRERLQNASPEETQKLLAQEQTVVRLALLMKDRQLESYGELDLLLRQFGTSLDQQIAIFGERQLGYEAVRGHLSGKKYEVTHQEMLDYYQEHAADYAVPAKAKFEILTVKFANMSSKAEALDLISQMGNAVYLGGTPFAAVAKKSSQEPNASLGGEYDWVNQGSLASKVIDEAIFSLEIDKLSQIIEDDSGYHIVRVKERRAATQASFFEEQREIKKTIESKKRDAERQKFLEQIQARTQIWTIYDPPADREATSSGGVQR